MSNTDPASETAKAAQELAKTTGKAIEAAQKMGSFVAKYVAGSLEQAMGIFEDKLRYIRWERQQRLIVRAELFMREQGIEQPSRRLPMKFGVPLLQGAAMEDDDALQDMWARLLVNAIDKNSGVSLQRAYIEILSQLSPFEARILNAIYSLPAIDIVRGMTQGVFTDDLPDTASLAPDIPFDFEKQPSDEVCLSLANLQRLGCLRIATTMEDRELYRLVHPTLLGQRFIEACTLRAKS